MKVSPLEFPDILLIEPEIFEDDRGQFFESFNQNAFQEATGVFSTFVQDNRSLSKKNVLRGLHYQLPPKAQGKLISVIHGSVFDVALDIRKDSSTFGDWVGIEISAESKQQLWIPKGFAHGFVSLSDFSELFYKTTDYYSPEHEHCIVWDDPDIAIKWPIQDEPQLSKKDQLGTRLQNAKVFS